MDITGSRISFSSLTLNHNGKVSDENSYFVIFSNSTKSTIVNIKDTNFNLNNNGLRGITILNWKGNVNNSIFRGKESNTLVCTGNWTGNLYNSNITSNNYGYGVFVNNWIGKVSKSTIIVKGYGSSGFCINSSSKGLIENRRFMLKKE